MKFIRPAREEDLDALVQLANMSVGGVTSLPANRALLQEKIAHSIADFAQPGSSRRSYLFALEDGETGEMVGCCGLVSMTDPEDGLDFLVRNGEGFRFVHFDEGPAEVKTLFVRADHRQGGYGRLLSLSRQLFIALAPDRFAPQVIARMRGYADEAGRNPFWEEAGRPFYGCDYLEAERGRGIDPAFVQPHTPPRLSPAALAVVGLFHPNTAAAVALLEQEGFAPNAFTDPFNGAPVYEAQRDALRGVRDGLRRPVSQIRPGHPGHHWIVSNTDPHNFRATYASFDPDHVVLLPEVAAALEVGVGDEVLFFASHEGRL